MSAKPKPPPPRPLEERMAEILARGPIRPEDAPFDDLPESEEERRKVAEARASIAAGNTRSQEEIEAMIAEWRRREGG